MSIAHVLPERIQDVRQYVLVARGCAYPRNINLKIYLKFTLYVVYMILPSDLNILVQ